MRLTLLAAAAAILVAIPICANGGQASSRGQKQAKAPKAIAMTPQQIVEVRRVGMRLAAADIQLLRTAAEKGAALPPMGRAARSLAEWGAVLPSLFPAGTGPGTGQTRAKAEIWTNRADFEQRARTFSEAAERLVAAAAANDMAAGGVAWDATWEGCNACHRLYRSEPPSSQ